MENREEYLKELIKDAEWSIKYHSDKIINMAKNVSLDEFENGWHKRQLDKSLVLLEQLNK